MANSKNKGILSTIFIALLAVGLWIWYTRQSQQEPVVKSLSPAERQEMQREYVGTISTSTDGMMLYDNEKLGLTFKFPKGWRIGDNHIVYGTFQLFNYPDTGSGKDFSPDAKINKIEAVVLEKSYFNDEPSSDYPERSRRTESIQVNGLDITKRDVTLTGGQQMRTYIIPVPTLENYLMHITMYGNPDNFYILDDLVETIKWK